MGYGGEEQGKKKLRGEGARFRGGWQRKGRKGKGNQTKEMPVTARRREQTIKKKDLLQRCGEGLEKGLEPHTHRKSRNDERRRGRTQAQTDLST